MAGYNPYPDSKNSLLTGVMNDENKENEWELNQRWISPDQAQSVQQSYAISNLAGMTNETITHSADLAGSQDDMGGSNLNQLLDKASVLGGNTIGTSIGAAAGNPGVGAMAGNMSGNALGDIPGYVTSIGAKNANKEYMKDPTLANAEKAAKWNYANGNVDMDVYNALTGEGPSKYYRDDDQDKLLRKQVVLGGVDRHSANIGRGVN